MGSPVLGIDLGTTNSVVAVADQDGVRVLADGEGRRLTPSVVSFHPTGDVLVGATARERRLVDAPNTIASVKRLIGRPYRSPEVRRSAQRFAFDVAESESGGVLVQARGQRYSLPEISAFVLQRVRDIAVAALGAEVSQAVVTVPANFNELQRTATRDAGRIAGLQVLRIINEPTAAALAYGFGAQTRERVAVYDLGGGTFDVSILDLSGDVIEVLATAGDTHLGGDDLDGLIADRMAQRFLEQHRVDLAADRQGNERLRMAAEWLKCQLSANEHAEVTVEEVAYGARGRPLDLQFSMTVAEMEQLAFPLLGRTFDICEEALRTAGLRPSQLDRVILVGGQTRMPQIRRMVAEYFGRDPLVSVDPDEVVAQGAALQALALSGMRRPSWRSPLSEPPPGAKLTRGKGGGSFFPAPDDAAARGEVPVPPPGRLPREVVPSELRGTLKGVGQSGASRPSAELRSTLKGVGDSQPAPAIDRAFEALTGGKGQAEVDFDDEATEIYRAPTPDTAERQKLARMALQKRPARAEMPVVAREEAAPGVVESVAPSPLEGREPRPARRSKVPPPPPPTAHGRRVEVPDDEADLPAVLRTDAPAAADGEPETARARRVRPSTPRPGPAPAADPGPPPVAAPLLLDVTPQTLAIETTGGFCEPVIERNAPIPTEQRRVFSTSQDDQTLVRIRVCQGESRKIEENQILGYLELLRLPKAPRGEVRIGVTFIMDADGTLQARARDLKTGKEHAIVISLVGGLSNAEIAKLRERHAAIAVGG